MRKQTIWAAALAALALTGCRKDLCYDHDAHALGVRVDVTTTWLREWELHDFGGTNWETAWPVTWGMGYADLAPAVPEGLRAQVFKGEAMETRANMEPTGGRLSMSGGEHSILFYNNDTEYIVFHDTESSAEATASTRSRSRSTYALKEGEETVNAPDQLYGAYVADYEAVPTDTVTPLPVTMRPLVYTYLVCYEFSHGLEYVALARGALSGMAGGVYLRDGRTTEEKVTVLFDEAEIVEGFGAYALVKSFGAPGMTNGDYVSRAPEDQTFGLNLELRLKNGKMLPPFDFDVTEQVRLQPFGGIIWVSGIEVSDEDGTEGGSVFDPDVKDWGEYEDVVLPLD